MSWQPPQVSTKRCFIGPSGQSLAVYWAWAGVLAARMSAKAALPTSCLLSAFRMSVLPVWPEPALACGMSESNINGFHHHTFWQPHERPRHAPDDTALSPHAVVPARPRQDALPQARRWRGQDREGDGQGYAGGRA